MKAPEGGDFTSSFVGQWKVFPVWKAWVEADYDSLKESDVPIDAMQKLNNGTFVYWRASNEAQAKESCKALGLKFGPRTTLRWEMPTTTMIGFNGEDAGATFGDTVSVDVSVSSMRSPSKHEYQLIFLPSLVQELGLALGYLKERIYDYEAMIASVEQVNLEYEHRMIGNGKSFEESELWQARVKIWAALGEDDPRNFTRNQGGQYDVESDKMQKILRLTVGEIDEKTGDLKEAKPIWARLTRVANPKVPEADKKAFSVNVVGRIWKTREMALAEVAPDSNGDHPPMPAGWESASPSDLVGIIKDYVAEHYAGKPKAIVLKGIKKNEAALTEEYSLTADDIEAWWDYVFK